MLMLRNWYVTRDLPFEKDAAFRYVPIIIGLMIFLAILALGGSQMISSHLQSWEKSFTKGFTVEMPITYEVNDPLASKISQEQALLLALRNLKGVEEASPISKATLSPFIDPFSSEQNNLIVMDVRMREGYDVDLKKIKTELNIFPDISIRDHREWRETTATFARTFIFIGILLATFIGVAAIATIVFVTRTGLQVHHKTIEILHLVGAQHRYIAQQFQHYAFILARKGSAIGLALLSFSLLMIAFMIGIETTWGYLSTVSSWQLLLILAFTPALAVLLTVLSAHITVISTLSKTSSW